MSVSKWAYEPYKCDGEFCIGDCDLCYKAELEEENVGDDKQHGRTDKRERD